MKKTQTQIKTEKAKKIKIFGFATLGLTMVAGATALALTSCSKPSTETTYTITENKDFKAAETAKNPYGGFEITISIKFPDVAKETEETWYRIALKEDHSDIAELKVKFAKGNKISKDEYTKVTSKTSQGGYGFTKTCPYKTKLSGMKSTLSKEESMEFTKALCSTAEAGDSNANDILNEMLKK